ncbi:MAG TPA: response regulator [Azonexus sp.]
MSPATVFIVDDEASVRKATARLLAAAGLPAATFASAAEFLAAYDPAMPGCLLLDLSMPGQSGLDLQLALRAQGAPLPVIFLTGRADVQATVQAMKGGAIEFLTKPFEAEMLIASVHAAFARDAGERTKRAELADIRRRLATLTPRETQVLGCVIAGKLNKQTAAELGTVEKTIKVHRARVVEKLQVHSLAELVLLANKAGIVPETAAAAHPASGD